MAEIPPILHRRIRRAFVAWERKQDQEAHSYLRGIEEALGLTRDELRAQSSFRNGVCNISLHEKIGARAGRLQLIVAALLDVAHAYHDPDTVDYPLDALMGLAGDYGEKWLAETADLLKEWYNRKAGP